MKGKIGYVVSKYHWLLQNTTENVAQAMTMLHYPLKVGTEAVVRRRWKGRPHAVHPLRKRISKKKNTID